jgi:GDP-L-fucose synthase
MEKSDSIYIAGSSGLLGSAFVRELTKRGYNNLITKTHDELDLTHKGQVSEFFNTYHPDYVILAAAKVGGIAANIQYPVEFLLTNLEIQNNVIRASYQNNAKKLVVLGSSCVYPADCPQPIKEEYLMAGKLEPTNEGYALAKIAGLRLAQYYNTQYGLDVLLPMPCNLYGYGDSFDPDYSHVLSATVKKFVDAVDTDQPIVTMWGSGIARREFMHADDATNAILLLMEQWQSPEIINVGTGVDISIVGLANTIAKMVKYKGEILWESNKPDGMLQKCLDISKLNTTGFKPKYNLINGISMMINEYRGTK